ncbi:TonB family protein [Bordetella petrii]|uniref:TonB family protein n=1 Tax=Bordetella petrii TaxID=94624 RepID=UPI001E613699|nr:TonB family protein [Bordetella petrii]MCD0504680.1 TonB family protein [Bordetella petrii]
MQRSADSYSTPGRFLHWLSAPAQHYLRIGLAISLLLHAGALAWRFAAPAASRPMQAPLEIVLVNARTESAPAQAQVIAQNQVDGGGNADRGGVATTPLPRTGESAETIVLQAMRKRQAQLEAEQVKLLTQLQAQPKAGTERQPVYPWPDATAQGEDVHEQPGLVQNAQVAALASRIQSYNAQPRKEFVAPSAQASRYAAYMDAWRTRIEAIGTQHYPDEARGRIYGSLQITVSVRADGSVANVEIDQPSEHAILNQAARRIVQLAAPFPPFPPDIANEADMLVITRTWHFVNDTLETQAP